jgi:hypothetical protein
MREANAVTIRVNFSRSWGNSRPTIGSEKGEIEHGEANGPLRPQAGALLGDRRSLALAHVVVAELRIRE